MAPTPAHLRAAADQLRSTGHRLDAALDPLSALGGHATWQGPAATSHPRAAVGIEGRMAAVRADLTRCADRLDRRADALAAEAAAEARRAAEAAAPFRGDAGRGLAPSPPDHDLRLPDLAVPPRTFADALLGGDGSA